MQLLASWWNILKSPWNQNWQLLFLMEYCSSLFINELSNIYFKTFIPSLSLFWWGGRDNLSLTWDRPIANHNHPTQFPMDSLHFFLFREAVSLEYTFYREERTIATPANFRFTLSLYLILCRKVIFQINCVQNKSYFQCSLQQDLFF